MHRCTSGSRHVKSVLVSLIRDMFIPIIAYIVCKSCTFVAILWSKVVRHSILDPGSRVLDPEVKLFLKPFMILYMLIFKLLVVGVQDE